MNSTYNKELSSSMKNSNKEFVKEQYKLDHKKNAAKVALYYAHGQTEKTENTFDGTKRDSKAAEQLNKKAVKSINLAENIVTAAKQSLLDSGKATSNVSTAASNMQIAANAITKLAGDVAALMSVANNTANESKIQQHTSIANGLIQNAAKKAEEVSLVSMQATIEAAQATASNVVTDAEAGLAAVKELHSSTASNYSNLQQATVADNESLTEAKKNEKLASAVHDITKKQDQAIKSTRSQINKVSNHELLMVDPQVEMEKQERKELKKKGNFKDLIIYPISKIPQGDSYTISFKAFDNEDQIQYYRLIVAKYDDAEAFDINIAKDLQPGTYYQFEPVNEDDGDKNESKSGHQKDDSDKVYANTFHLLGVKVPAVSKKNIGELVDGTWQVIHLDNDQELYFNNIQNHLAVDYKGKPIDRGTPYVAYVYVVYQGQYQHSIDSTVGELSQPSEQLTLQRKLYAPKHVNLHPGYFNSKNLGVFFQLPIKHYDPANLEYRIMLLESENINAERINEHIEMAIENLEKTEFRYNVENNKLQLYTTRVNELQSEYENLSDQIELMENSSNTKGLRDLKKRREDVAKDRDDTQALIDGTKNRKGQEEITRQAKIDYQKAKSFEAAESQKKQSDFIFDTDLMLTVSAANYYVAEPNKWTFKSAGIKWIESIIAYEEAKFNLHELIVNAEPQELTELKNAYNQQLGQVEVAKAHAEQMDLELEKAKEKNRETPKNDPDKKKVEEALEQAKKHYNHAKNEQQDAEDKLHNIEREMEVAKELGDDVSPQKLAELVNEMIKAGYLIEKYEYLLLMMLWTFFEDEIKKEEFEKLLQSLLDYFEVTLEEIIELIGTGERPHVRVPKEEFKFFEVKPPLVLMYTELGEDATDNYGEPLYQNQSDFMKNAIDDFESLIAIEDLKERKSEFKKHASKYTPKKVMEFLEASKKSDKSYRSVVLSALSASNVQDIPEYQNEHSDYSREVALYITQ